MNEQPYFVEDETQSSAMLQNDEFIEAFAACADILGSCFLFHPVKEQAAQVFSRLTGRLAKSATDARQRFLYVRVKANFPRRSPKSLRGCFAVRE